MSTYKELSPAPQKRRKASLLHPLFSAWREADQRVSAPVTGAERVHKQAWTPARRPESLATDVRLCEYWPGERVLAGGHAQEPYIQVCLADRGPVSWGGRAWADFRLVPARSARFRRQS